jgi:hypothetical protein
MEMSESFKEFNKKKIEGTALVAVISGSLITGAYFYSQIEVQTQQNSFSTNATVFTEEDENGTLEAGIAAGQGLSFGRFNSVFNKTKRLNLSAGSQTLVSVDSEGNISEKLYYDDKHLFERDKQIMIEMAANESGYFEGSINLDIKTAQNKWGEKWLRLLYNYF